MLKPLFDQLIPTVEKLTVHQISEKAVKARLPGELIHEIERDAAWNPVARNALQTGVPQLTAKYLNKTGVSADYQPEIVVGTALASILTGHVMLMRRMDELIRKANPPTTPAAPAPEKKP